MKRLTQFNNKQVNKIYLFTDILYLFQRRFRCSIIINNILIYNLIIKYLLLK